MSKHTMVASTTNRKRKFIDIMNDEESKPLPSMKQKRFKSNDNDSNSIPFQALVDPYKWCHRQYHQQRRTEPQQQQPHREQQHRKPPSFANAPQRKTHNNYNSASALVNSDFLIRKWLNISNALLFELHRQQCLVDLEQKQNEILKMDARNQSLVERSKNSYLQALKAMNIDCNRLFGNGRLCDANRHLVSDIARVLSVVDLSGGHSSNPHEQPLVLKDEAKIALFHRRSLYTDFRCAHRLYLWPDGWSYLTLDNFHFYDANASTMEFISSIDRGLVPRVWSNRGARDKFNDRFFEQQRKQQQWQAQPPSDDPGQQQQQQQYQQQRFDSKLRDKISQQYPYVNGNLFVEVFDCRFITNYDRYKQQQQQQQGQTKEHSMCCLLEYKENIEFNRVFLNGQTALHFKESLFDVPLFATSNYISSSSSSSHSHHHMYRMLLRAYHTRTKAKFNHLRRRYPFYARHKQDMMRVLLDTWSAYKTMHSRHRQQSQSYASYATLVAHTKQLKQCKHTLLECAHDAYDPLLSQFDAWNIAGYERRIETHRAIEQLQHELAQAHQQQQQQQQQSGTSTAAAAAAEEQLRSKQIAERLRLTKLVSSKTLQAQIEKHILLRLYPRLPLQPNVEVMQVMNYAHYVRGQSIVRNEFDHTRIATKMKTFYEDQDEEEEEEQQSSRTNNVIVDGIDQSQQFLHFIRRNGEETLYNLLESARDHVPYLTDFGVTQTWEEPRKTPGYAIPKYAAGHFDPRVCVLLKRIGEHASMVMVLRIDYLQWSQDCKKEHGDGVWLFCVRQMQHTHSSDDNGINCEHYINNENSVDNIVQSQECLTLNSAVRLFHQTLNYQLCQTQSAFPAKLVYSQNTKFDSLVTKRDEQNGKEQQETSIFEIL